MFQEQAGNADLFTNLADHRLIGTLHFGNEQRQVCCGYIEDACVIWELTINVPHQFVGAMAGPVENHCLVDGRNSFELVVSNKRPFRKNASVALSSYSDGPLRIERLSPRG